MQIREFTYRDVALLSIDWLFMYFTKKRQLGKKINKFNDKLAGNM